ncbi:MAG TPA: response regulator [Bdellovibrionales bacterium]|nr:response regulator [Bdellovibrionales bacterium]
MIRLVVADDAPFIREIVRNVCEKVGIEVVGEAIDGNEAVKLAKTLKPDVVLLDIIMPNKSGIEAAREIASFDSKVKMIAFSTADQETMVVRALEAGCCSFVVKPFKAEDLVRAVKQSLGGAHE